MSSFPHSRWGCNKMKMSVFWARVLRGGMAWICCDVEWVRLQDVTSTWSLGRVKPRSLSLSFVCRIRAPPYLWACSSAPFC
ncbi:hypothetical protein BDP81DRAFT_416492 [Colletotrichum phormii]|uniref:Uncharacterized protein n=1 Tax=Colletotrichum phormii TaxID=359342 RepID=A0AAJ0A565_9PEZI|nr:uncharacterized protein BDP81DRAFT_416492 [Colletotrichum phormii]KAK1654790.1 hypothetical protein BDP81DRAFT_416492 [Colletotrichum phormii]